MTDYSSNPFGKKIDWDTAEVENEAVGDLPVYGSAGVPSLLASAAKGDILSWNGSKIATRLALGSNGQALVVDTSQATGLKWGGVGSVLEDQSTMDTTTYTEGTGTPTVKQTLTFTPPNARNKIVAVNLNADIRHDTGGASTAAFRASISDGTNEILIGTSSDTPETSFQNKDVGDVISKDLSALSGSATFMFNQSSYTLKAYLYDNGQAGNAEFKNLVWTVQYLDGYTQTIDSAKFT